MIYTTDTKDLNTNIQDGEIELQIQKDSKTLKSDSFNKEKDLVDFITINIKRFTKEVLNDELLSFEIDKPIDKQEFVGVDKELIILTTQFDINTYKTIKHYNLPIRYIFFDKTKWLEIKEH